ncbi:uncharacterized protein CTHT_0049280 [Thermochaetoides thermophila DSM 1495]|uniref:Mtf2-like C-terminal domain-containing protein n=1 Tax=Chaetomium thermophilum (strain DSM 1495 / CBS 144.50 / IMI 039719) TaxID=759272 RepID=G0SB87_CHATD|nr:hypothetical protein CTHT_0049280 [Thermochaetoides thermophila DSM 1495]EGS19467.1 hypothetical protein CTHT_0049280 [Thermochaetoides thermophila DSM 1495]
MSTTVMPFLYQTRTLQRLSRPGSAPRTLRMLLHSSATLRYPRAHSRRPKRTDNTIPFELPEGYQPPDSETPAFVEVDPETGLRSTITPSERAAFSRIFEEIAAKRAAQAAAAGIPPAGTTSAPQTAANAVPSRPDQSFTDVDDFSIRTKEPDHNAFRDTINIIVQDAAEVHTNAKRQLGKTFEPLHPLGQLTAATEWEKALLRFPPSLRQAARIALGTMEEDAAAEKAPPPSTTHPIHDEIVNEETKLGAQIDVALDPLSTPVKNEALRRAERRRVEAKMLQCKTDFELWDVLEEEVFPMVEKLGLDEESTKAATKNGKRGRGKRKDKLPVHIYGPLYPAYLMAALRLLDTRFARSSPLALQVLPRVKELGLASYVLGVSTPFYNELLRIHWKRHGDPRAVFDLLEEMRAVGLYCDEVTKDIVLNIQQYLDASAKGKEGPFLGELATLPEYEFALMPRARHWLKAIETQMWERKQDLRV